MSNVKVKSKTPRLIVLTLIMFTIAAGLTVSFKSEAADLRSKIAGMFQGFMGREDSDYKNKYNDDKIAYDDGDREGDDDLEMGISAAEKKAGKEKRSLDDLSINGTDGRGPGGGDDNASARRLLKEAEAKLAEYQFNQAASRAGQVISLGCDESLKKSARFIQEKAVAVRKLSKAVKPNVTAGFADIKDVRLTTGTLRGRVIRNGDGSVTIIQDGGIKSKFSEDDILEIKEVKADNAVAKVIGAFESSYKEAERHNMPMPFYRVGVYAHKNKLSEKGYDALGKAFDLAYGQGGLLKLVREDEARGVLAQGVWYDDVNNLKMARKYYQDCMREYGDTDASKTARKFFDYSLKKEQREKEAVKRKKAAQIEARKKREADAKARAANRDKPGNDILAETAPALAADGEADVAAPAPEPVRQYSGAVAKKLSQANSYYNEAMGHMKKGFSYPPSAKRNAAFKKAEDLFRKSVDLYGPIYEKTKDEDIDIKLAKAGEQLYNSIKLRTMH